MHISRISNYVQISARVDPDELDVDIDDQIDAEYRAGVERALAPYILHMVALLKATRNKLPYQMHLVPVGGRFYARPTANEHAFHLTELFASLSLAHDHRVDFVELCVDNTPRPNTFNAALCFDCKLCGVSLEFCS